MLGPIALVIASVILCYSTEPVISSTEDVYNNLFEEGGPLLPKLHLLQYAGQSYYVADKFKGRFLEAADFCHLIGMKLAVIDSDDLNTKLYRHMQDINAGDNFWASAVRYFDDETWVWLSTGVPVEYTNWRLDTPNDTNVQCIQFRNERGVGLLWEDEYCNQVNFPICERTSFNYEPCLVQGNEYPEDSSIESGSFVVQHHI